MLIPDYVVFDRKERDIFEPVRRWLSFLQPEAKQKAACIYCGLVTRPEVKEAMGIWVRVKAEVCRRKLHLGVSATALEEIEKVVSILSLRVWGNWS